MAQSRQVMLREKWQPRSPAFINHTKHSEKLNLIWGEAPSILSALGLDKEWKGAEHGLGPRSTLTALASGLAHGEELPSPLYSKLMAHATRESSHGQVLHHGHLTDWPPPLVHQEPPLLCTSRGRKWKLREKEWLQKLGRGTARSDTKAPRQWDNRQVMLLCPQEALSSFACLHLWKVSNRWLSTIPSQLVSGAKDMCTDKPVRAPSLEISVWTKRTPSRNLWSSNRNKVGSQDKCQAKSCGSWMRLSSKAWPPVGLLGEHPHQIAPSRTQRWLIFCLELPCKLVPQTFDFATQHSPDKNSLPGWDNLISVCPAPWRKRRSPTSSMLWRVE